MCINMFQYVSTMYQHDNIWYQYLTTCINMHQPPMKALKTSTSTLESQSDITWKNHSTADFSARFHWQHVSVHLPSVPESASKKLQGTSRTNLRHVTNTFVIHGIFRNVVSHWTALLSSELRGVAGQGPGTKCSGQCGWTVGSGRQRVTLLQRWWISCWCFNH